MVENQSAYEKLAGDDGNRWIASARAPRTWRQHASSVSLFQTWCAEGDRCPLPASADDILSYVLHLAERGHTWQTIKTYLNGIAAWHRLRGHEFDRRRAAETLRGIKRVSGASRQARPLLAEDLRGILAALDPRRPADARDGALLAIGFAAALRRSELCGLDWQTQNAKSTGVLSLFPGGEIAIELLKSKTAQGDPVWIEIANSDMPDAAEWLGHWRRHIDLTPGAPVFRRLSKAGKPFGWRLSDGATTEIIRRRVIDFEVSRGIDPDAASSRAQAFSGHSLRAGFATSAARAGVHEWRIRQRLRHRSPDMVARYVRAAETRTESGLAGLGFARAGEDTKPPMALPAQSGQKCGARRGGGRPCQAVALPNGRCSRHGGLSTGPKTAEGRASLSKAARDTQKRLWAERREGKRPMPKSKKQEGQPCQA